MVLVRAASGTAEVCQLTRLLHGVALCVAQSIQPAPQHFPTATQQQSRVSLHVWSNRPATKATAMSRHNTRSQHTRNMCASIRRATGTACGQAEAGTGAGRGRAGQPSRRRRCR